MARKITSVQLHSLSLSWIIFSLSLIICYYYVYFVSYFSVQPPVRRKPTRSLTEVRPDAYIFDDGAHFEVRTVEEKDENSDSGDGGIVMRPPAERRVNILEERQRSSQDSKLSVTGSSDRGEESDISTEALQQLNLDDVRYVTVLFFIIYQVNNFLSYYNALVYNKIYIFDYN